MGRPSSFSEEMANVICDRIAEGESLRTICKDDDLPDARTVYRWLDANEAFRQQYTRARELQADTLFDEILQIADESHGDYMEDPKGGAVVNNEAIARSRLRVDARKWMAGKLRPKVYGEKVQVGGAEDLPPVKLFTAIERRIVRADGGT